MVGLAAAKAFAPSDAPTRFTLASIACSILPDADVLGFSLGIPYEYLLGHRGFFHSLTQTVKEWNRLEMETPEFRSTQATLEKMIEEAALHA